MKVTLEIQTAISGLSLKIVCDYDHRGDTLVLFIHGLGCSRIHYSAAFSGIYLPGLSILVPDLAGHGDSGRSSELDYSMEQHALILEDILSHFPEKKIHLVCHSMGGAIGLLLEKKIHDRILSFVNIEGNLVYPDCNTDSKFYQPHENFYLTKIFPGIVRRLEKSDDPASREWAVTIRLADPVAFFRSSRSLAEWTGSRKLLSMFLDVNYPKCYIYGEHSPVRSILDFLPREKTIMIKGSGHFPMVDNPEGLYKCIERLIRGSRQ